MSGKIPKGTHHKATNQLVVRLSGKDFYCGRWGSKKAQREYDRLIAEWIANGRSLPSDAPLIVELIAAFWAHAKGHYRKHGRPTDELACYRSCLKHLREMYGDKEAGEFGPMGLKAIRQKMIDAGNSRSYINKQVARLKHVFQWGVANDLAPVEVHQKLLCVEGLRAGKTEARETGPVLPVAIEAVEATLPHLYKSLADMVRFHLLTGGRPSEICEMRPGDIQRDMPVWEYIPREHKTEHLGRQRIIFIGPKAQAILLPYLLRDGECFTSRRKIPLTDRNYRDAIHRACDKAKIPRWNPNQLRHAAGTEIRKRRGLEAAQVVLGHSKADTTQIYAERDYELARSAMLEIG